MATPPDVAEAEPAAVQLTISGDQISVRNGLRALFDTFLVRRLAAADRGDVEIVLAEVLNNIVEHAYCSRSGDIDIALQLAPGALVCTITDTGAPMPPGGPPPGGLPDYTSIESLPEGGFGWHFSRSRSTALRYSRENNGNRLEFRLPMTQSP